nr:S24 family peptidase [Halomonas campisalis]
MDTNAQNQYLNALKNRIACAKGYLLMNEETSIATRLRKLMEEQGLGENELARRSHVPQPTIHRILTGASKSPRINNLEKIAGALGTSVTYLAHGGRHQAGTASVGKAGILPAIANVASGLFSTGRADSSPPLYQYPILSLSDIIPSAQARKALTSQHWQVEPSGHKAQDQAFWLKIQGDAMSAPTGASPSLPEGTLVLLDTGLPASPGKLVLATLPDSPKPTFRQLIEDSGSQYLKPLNPAYPLILLKNLSQVIAVAVEAKTHL